MREETLPNSDSLDPVYVITRLPTGQHAWMFPAYACLQLDSKSDFEFDFGLGTWTSEERKVDDCASS